MVARPDDPPRSPRISPPRLDPAAVADPLSGAAISGASRRLRALAMLSGSLTDSLGPQDAARLVEQKALSALGATSAVVMTLGSFPPATPPAAPASDPAGDAALTLIDAIGLPAEVRAVLERLSLDAPVPMAEVARTGEPLFLPGESELGRYPEWSVAMIRAGVRSAAIVPVWANGELRGVLGLAWPDPQEFDEDDRAFVLTLGVMCAQAIMRAHLRAAEWSAREAVDAANRSKTRFLTMISHELRTPMNAVLGYTDIIAAGADGPVTALQRTHLGRVQASGKHLLALIEELLGYARVEAGSVAVAAEPVLMADLVEESLVLVRPIAATKGLSIRTECAGDPVTLLTDPRKVRQILVNLLANAVKYTDAGEIVLTCRTKTNGEDVAVSFEVADSGRGIAAADQEHVFDAFWQKDGISTPGSGTGLGLPVARQLARLLGGDVLLTLSAVGRGSTFALSIPARYAATVASR